MSIVYSILANTSIDAETTYDVPGLAVKGKFTLLFSCASEEVSVEFSFMPLNAILPVQISYPMEAPSLVLSSDALVQPGWVKLFDLPEGVLNTKIITGSVGSSALLVYMPNG